VRRSVLEESTRPEYIIPVGSADGVWGMIKRVGRFKGEGWLALWKGTLFAVTRSWFLCSLWNSHAGLLTTFVTDAVSMNLQPLIHSILRSILSPDLTPHNYVLPVASHIITGLILSPLDLVRTRLIVQSSLGRHRTYTGPLDALSKILRYEGGLKGVYLHPHLLYPAILDNMLRPLVLHALPGLLKSYLPAHVTQETHPMVCALAELVGSCAGLLVTLPIETVRRRLQVQVRGSAKPIKTCVETRPTGYYGVVDCVWKVLAEERSDLPVVPVARRRGKGKGKARAEKNVEEEGWLRNMGLGQLYRGLGVRVGASVFVFVLGLLSSGEDMDGGWAEL
jgi:fusion and transport protein UGO1